MFEEVQIASNHCDHSPADILQWLTDTWPSMTQFVIKVFNEKNIGELSLEEAREVLISCEGDAPKALALSVQERLSKVSSLSFHSFELFYSW